MQSDGLVREMDPDAPNRDDARGLAADDAVRMFVTPGISGDSRPVIRTTRRQWRRRFMRVYGRGS